MQRLVDAVTTTQGATRDVVGARHRPAVRRAQGPESIERSVERSSTSTPPARCTSRCAVPGAFKRRLNESGWLADEVDRGGHARTGKRRPRWLALLTGAVLFQMARARRSKALPREFALAVTADRVVAFAMSPWKEGEAVTDSVAVVRIKPGELASWPRGVGAPDRSSTSASGRPAGRCARPAPSRFPVTSEGRSRAPAS